MKVIVNKKQYKQIINSQSIENNFVNEWGMYIKDIIIGKIENKNLNENVVSINNMGLKLLNKKFFNKLPIENMVLNIYNYNGSDFSCEWLNENIYLNENKKIKDVSLNIILDSNKELFNEINENKIKVCIVKIKEWYENNY